MIPKTLPIAKAVAAGAFKESDSILLDGEIGHSQTTLILTRTYPYSPASVLLLLLFSQA